MSSEKTQTGKLSLDEKVTLFKDRFVSRTDVFYEKKLKEGLETDPETGLQVKTTIKSFYTVCGNYGNKEVCLIVQNKGNCSSCSSRTNQPLNDIWLKKHILGNSTVCLVPITEHGVKFAALDFDRTIDDGGLAGVFQDAKMTRDYCSSIGIQSYLARSSDKGYHLYFFFDDWVEGHKVMSLFSHINIKVGFAARSQTMGVAPPEQFPRQAYNKDAYGNAIRIPLSEPDVRQGRNCFVDDEAKPIALDLQWNLLSTVKLNKASDFDATLATAKVEIIEFSGSHHKTRMVKKKVMGADGVEREEEVEETGPIAQRGSFWNVVAACPAMQEYWAKDEAGKYIWDYSNPRGLFHAARLASLNLAMSTIDGERILLERWNNPMTQKNIDLAKREGYRPATCKWMQDNNVCKKGKHPKNGENKTYCYKKIPPLSMVHGKLVENFYNLEEALWDEPSPIRRSTENKMTVEEVKERLRLLASILKTQEKIDSGDIKVELNEKGEPKIDEKWAKEGFRPDNVPELLENIVKRVAFFKKFEREEITLFVTSEKLFTKADWNTRLKAAGVKASSEKIKEVTTKNKSFAFGTKTYSLEDNKITSIFVDAKGFVHTQDFANFWIERTAEPATVDIRERKNKTSYVYKDRLFDLTIHPNQGQPRRVVMENSIFASTHLFFQSIRAAGGTDIQYTSSKDSYDIMMAAISNFSDPIAETYNLGQIGYYPDLKGVKKYIMPSVVVTKDEITENKDFTVTLVSDYTQGLNFQIIDSDRLKEVSRHIIADFFNCNNPMITMTCFAHAMASVCTEPIENARSWKKSPVLWLAGSLSKGKTFVLENTKFFFGDFSKSGNIGMGGSEKAQTGLLSEFRHALAVIDDYKAIHTKDNGMGMLKLINDTYDRKSATALTKEGKLRAHANSAQGLLGVTGEDFPTKDASAVSRLIIVDTDLEGKRPEGNRVLKMRHLYSGFTPYVIKHILQFKNEAIGELWDKFYNEFNPEIVEDEEKAGGARISENLTLNYFGFYMAVDMMVANGVIPQTNGDALLHQHRTNLKLIKQKMINEVASARGSIVFLNLMNQLLSDSTRYVITGWPGSEIESANRAETLGFYSDKTPDVVFIHNELAYAAVSKLARNSNTVIQTWPHVSRQLAEDGAYAEKYTDRKDNKFSCRRKIPNGKSQRVYPIKAELLGFDPALKVVQQPTKKDQEIPTKETKLALD